MALQALAQRVLVSHARPEAFVDKTIAILGRLGYRILEPSSWDAGDVALGEPELMIVDEARQADLEEGGSLARFGLLPRLLLTGRHGVTGERPGIVGAVRRPAGLHDLYRVIQQVFEDTPRTTPRVDTDLVVRCGHAGTRFDGELLSISENGGLLRCDGTLPLGARFDLAMELPGEGALSLQAEAAYQLVPNTGVVFSGLAPQARAAIGQFVSGVLLGGP